MTVSLRNCGFNGHRLSVLEYIYRKVIHTKKINGNKDRTTYAFSAATEKNVNWNQIYGAILLGAMQPSYRSAYDYLSRGFPQVKIPVKMDSHLANTCPQNSIGIRKICAAGGACGIFSLSFFWGFFGWFLVLLCQSYMKWL